MRTNRVCLSGSVVPHSEWCFFFSVNLPINFKIYLFTYFYNRVILHFVNVPHFFIYSLSEGLLGFFQVLTIMNNAGMNIVEQMSLWYECAFFEYMPKSGIARS